MDAGAQTDAQAPLPPMPTGLRQPPRPWADLSYEERDTYMTEVVNPTMRQLFQAYDRQAFSGFDCATCHGVDGRPSRNRMPSPELPPIWYSPTEREHQTRIYPRMSAFMNERVTPAMTQLLGMQPFNPMTRMGFACGRCHTTAMSRPATDGGMGSDGGGSDASRPSDGASTSGGAGRSDATPPTDAEGASDASASD